MTDQERLLALLDVFESALSDFTGLVRELRDDEWELPTDLADRSLTTGQLVTITGSPRTCASPSDFI